MASIRQAAQNVLDIAKDGIGWIVLYKKGRGWESEYCFPEYNERTNTMNWSDFDEEDMSKLREIIAIDPMAILVNSYVMNLGDVETMTRDDLAEALKWQYGLNHYELKDALPEESEQEETT